MKILEIEFTQFPPLHDQNKTRDLLLRVLHSYEIEQKVKAVTTDNLSEMGLEINHIRQSLNSNLGFQYINTDIYDAHAISYIVLSSTRLDR